MAVIRSGAAKACNYPYFRADDGSVFVNDSILKIFFLFVSKLFKLEISEVFVALAH